MAFTDIPIADTVQNIKTDKHKQSDIINNSILLCINCKNKVRAIPQAKGFIICYKCILTPGNSRLLQYKCKPQCFY